MPDAVAPDTPIDVLEVFGFATDLKVLGFAEPTEQNLLLPPPSMEDNAAATALPRGRI